MKFTLSWLKDHLDTTATLDAIEGKLSAIGLEVEGIEDAGAKLGAFTLARIVEAKPHPNADRLRVCQVEIAPGKPPVEVVCGAPNARAGLITVFAPLGTYIPGSRITLEKKPVRGVVSNGMLCSAAEHNMPFETTPRTGFFSSVILDPGIYVPSGANTVISPALAFGAPHTTSTAGLPAAIST